MNKEITPINQLPTNELIQQRDKTLLSVEKREYHIGLIGQCKIKDGSSFENSIELGLRRADAKGRLAQDQEKLNVLNQELSAYQQAKQYLDQVKLRQNQLDLMSQMVAQGNLFPQIFEKHQNEFQELTLLSETDPVLARGIARIRQEEERKIKSQETISANNSKFSKKSAQLLDLLTCSSADTMMTSEQITQTLWPGIDDYIARKRLSALLVYTKKGLLGTDFELVGISTPAQKKHGEKAKYYLRKKEQLTGTNSSLSKDTNIKMSQDIVKDKETPSVNKPEFGTLSRSDISMIATDLNRFKLSFKNKEDKTMQIDYGIMPIEDSILDELDKLDDDTPFANLRSMTEQQIHNDCVQLRIQALQKAKDIIESPEFVKISDQIYKQNLDVYHLLVNLFEINDKLMGISYNEDNIPVRKKGIDFLIDLVTNSEETEWTYYITNAQGKKIKRTAYSGVSVSEFVCSDKK